MAGAESPISTFIAGVPLRNPVLLAAGASGTLDEFGDVLDLSRVGGVVSKSITREARAGNPTWRVIEHRAGMLNAIGLANPGIAGFEEHYLPRAAAMPCGVFISVAGFGVEDYLAVAASVDEWGRRGVSSACDRLVRPESKSNSLLPQGAPIGSSAPSPSIDAVELNVSCPNVKAGCDFGLSPDALRELVTEVRKVVTRSALVVKLSPLVTDITLLARAAVDAGADALTISNTLPAMAIDVRTRKPRLANKTGGMSGPGLHPVAVKLVYECWTKVCHDGRGRGAPVPIIGAGGVMTWEDAAEFILAGASAVQMGTSLFADPRSPLKVVKGLEKWVRDQKVGSIAELVGAIQV